MASSANYPNSCSVHGVCSAGVVFTRLIQTLLTGHFNISSPYDYPKDVGEYFTHYEDDLWFDFIVVGAGSTGSVIASRLSENPNWTVLLIEAGGNPEFISEVPNYLFNTQGSKMDWKYTSARSNKSCLGMVDQRCPYPRGKVLGGSSTINAMMYVRGNAEDFNMWESLGNKGWNYENVLKYFKKSENVVGYSVVDDEQFEYLKYKPNFKGKVLSNKYHSRGGPLNVSRFADGGVGWLKEVICDSFEELAIPTRADINGKSQIGVTVVPGTLENGRRANVAKMYLNNVKNRRNLYVIKNALVQKLLINNNEVLGVQFVRNGIEREVYARKEVIVSAGAINSPHLLMLSGIGPQQHLRDVGIQTVLNLEGVGRNLQDHYIFLGLPVGIEKSKFKQVNRIDVLDDLLDFLTARPGSFSSIGLTDLTAFVSTNNTDLPDIQYVFMNFPKNDPNLLPEFLRAFHFTNDIKKQYFDLVKNWEVVLIAPTLLTPKGRGRIWLRKGNVNSSPIIQAGILSHQDDVNTILKGIKLAKDIISTNSFAALKSGSIFININECQGLSASGYWQCLMQYFTTSFFNPAGTCKMGPKTDPLAVVDNRLRVHNMKYLRVADASIMPTIVRGNLNAACIMIGEMVSDMIKEDWEKYHDSDLVLMETKKLVNLDLHGIMNFEEEVGN